MVFDSGEGNEWESDYECSKAFKEGKEARKNQVKPYAQYRESMVLLFIEKGKRKQKGIRFYGENRFAIWEGFVSPNVKMFNAPEAGVEGVTVQKSFASSFDSSYMERALNSVEQKPLVLVYEKDEV